MAAPLSQSCWNYFHLLCPILLRLSEILFSNYRTAIQFATVFCPWYIYTSLGSLFGGSSAEALGGRVCRHAHTLPAVVVLPSPSPGGRGTSAEQLLLGFLQHCTVGVVLLEEQNAGLRVRDRVMLVANKS